MKIEINLEVVQPPLSMPFPRVTVDWCPDEEEESEEDYEKRWEMTKDWCHLRARCILSGGEDAPSQKVLESARFPRGEIEARKQAFLRQIGKRSMEGVKW